MLLDCQDLGRFPPIPGWLNKPHQDKTGTENPISIPNTKKIEKDCIYILSEHTSFFSSLHRYLIVFCCFYPCSESTFLITFLM